MLPVVNFQCYQASFIIIPIVIYFLRIENYNHYLQDLLQYRYVTVAGKDNPLNVETFK